MIDNLFFKKIVGVFLIILTILLAVYMLNTMYKNFSSLMSGAPAQPTIEQNNTATHHSSKSELPKH